MTTHLTEDQVTSWLMGERPALLAAHVEECRVCTQRIAGTATLMHAFRDAIRATPVPEIQAKKIVTVVKRPAFAMPLAWAAATAIVISLSAAPLLRHKAVQPPVVLQPAQSVANDAALLQRVDEETAEMVPDSLQPLASLMHPVAMSAGNSASARIQGSTHK